MPGTSRQPLLGQRAAQRSRPRCAAPGDRRWRRPDPKRPADKQDKRSVVPIDPADVDTWLYASTQEATQLVRLAPAEAFIAAPALPDTPLLP